MTFISLRGFASPSFMAPPRRPQASCRSNSSPNQPTSTSSFSQTTGSSAGGPAAVNPAAIPSYTPIVAGLLAASLGMVAYGNMESQRQVSEGMARAAEKRGL